jgi:cytochrome P450
MKEAMRMHPGVSYPLERLVPDGGIKLCGHRLRQGTNVGINPFVVHQNRNIFGKDAAQFRPERWLEADAEQLKAMERTLLTVRSNLHPPFFQVLFVQSKQC